MVLPGHQIIPMDPELLPETCAYWVEASEVEEYLAIRVGEHGDGDSKFFENCPILYTPPSGVSASQTDQKPPKARSSEEQRWKCPFN